FFAAGFTGGPLAAVDAALVDAFFPVTFLAGAAAGTTFFVALRPAAAGPAAALRAGAGLALDAAFAGCSFFAAAAESPRVEPPLTRRSTRPSRPVTAAMPTSFHQTTDTAPVR